MEQQCRNNSFTVNKLKSGKIYDTILLVTGKQIAQTCAENRSPWLSACSFRTKQRGRVIEKETAIGLNIGDRD